ncbi:MAG: sugar transferase [Dorea sp.]|nr:sugar transferase [Dorea sp.]MCI9454006.1 sugar transferase [Dorea sp.]
MWKMRMLNLSIKRMLDILVSLISIILISPILLTILLLVKCTSKGPVLFKQERLGLHGESFQILKFRTMVVNAEHMGTGVYINEKSDPRITKIGKILRKSSLDELPQLFNILKGDMSLVGPRPPVTYHPYDGYQNYPQWAKKRFELLPGLTGLAQVELKSDATWDERITVDVRYVENFSVRMDILILLRTVIAVFKRDTF